MDNANGNYPGTIAGRLPPGKNITDQSIERKLSLGTRYVLGDRVFRYAHIKEDATVLKRGYPVVAYNTASLEKGKKLGTLTQGSQSVLWTVVQRQILRDQFANGYLLMQGGFVKGIESNSGEKAGNTIAIKFKELITQDDAASGNYGILCEGLYTNAKERTFGQTGPGLIIGVPVADLTGDYFGWLQTWGPCGVIGTAATLNDTAQVTGITPGIDAGSQNQVIATNPAMVPEERIVGYHVPYNTTNWDNEAFRMLFLTINP